MAARLLLISLPLLCLGLDTVLLGVNGARVGREGTYGVRGLLLALSRRLDRTLDGLGVGAS